MEPRLLRHGNNVTNGVNLKAISSSSFNGATSSQTWKSVDKANELLDKPALQWSHVFSDMEMQIWASGIAVGLPALQWSHVFSDMEMSR